MDNKSKNMQNLASLASLASSASSANPVKVGSTMETSPGGKLEIVLDGGTKIRSVEDMVKNIGKSELFVRKKITTKKPSTLNYVQISKISIQDIRQNALGQPIAHGWCVENGLLRLIAVDLNSNLSEIIKY